MCGKVFKSSKPTQYSQKYSYEELFQLISEIRLNEANISDTWRPPTPYKIEFAKKVCNPKQKEKTIHRILSTYLEGTKCIFLIFNSYIFNDKNRRMYNYYILKICIWYLQVSSLGVGISALFFFSLAVGVKYSITVSVNFLRSFLHSKKICFIQSFVRTLMNHCAKCQHHI